MREWLKYLWISIILLYAPLSFADEARLSEISVTASPSTKIILNLNQTVPYKVFTLPNPSRLVVDLQKTQYGFSKGKSLDFSGTDVTDYRHGIQDGYNLRMVFDLKEPMNFTVETNHENGFQINLNLSSASKKMPSGAVEKVVSAPKVASTQAVLEAQLKKQIDTQIKNEKSEIPEEAIPPKIETPAKGVKEVSGAEKTEGKKSGALPKTDQLTKAITVAASDKTEIPEKLASSIAPVPVDSTAVASAAVVSSVSVVKSPQKKRRFIVVIDAGHGGKDPGATGPSGSHEKNITLAIAKKLQALVNSESGMKAVLTRNGDYYVGLRQRLMIARKAKGDVFIAIHADAFNQPDAEGASVFALSLHGSSSEAALWLAQKENYSELGGIDLNGIQDQDAQVRSVLIDLSQTATIAGSLQLGRAVIQQMQQLTELHHGVVEQAPFMVLKSPDIPSILVETGFLTNPKEEQRLKTDAYQAKIAKAIMNGVEEYYKNTPTNISVATAA